MIVQRYPEPFIAPMRAELSRLGFEEVELARLLGSVGVGEFDIEQAWGGMPEYVQENLQSAYSLHVHFADAESFAAFTELIGQPHIKTTARSIWFPAQENTPFGAVKAESALSRLECTVAACKCAVRVDYGPSADVGLHECPDCGHLLTLHQFEGGT